MENTITIKVGDTIIYKNEPYATYIVLSIEKNEFCKGGYGVATEDGYYFSIDEVRRVLI